MASTYSAFCTYGPQTNLAAIEDILEACGSDLEEIHNESCGFFDKIRLARGTIATYIGGGYAPSAMWASLADEDKLEVAAACLTRVGHWDGRSFK